MNGLPSSVSNSDSTMARGRWQHRLPDGRVQCDLCPRYCRLRDGQRAFCFVRERVGDEIVLSSYGRATGFCIDPIEKKPLNHFYPGTSVLSFGTAGCNLGCKFCQNWDISKARDIARLSESASPEQIARTAARMGCSSVAFTYNDPVIFAEYAIDTARACRELGVHSVAVTAGYISERARPAFFSAMDAANIDLKAFSDRFYRKLCFAALAPVLETLVFLKHETDVWFEVTTLLVPGQNDSEEEVERLSSWVLEHLGPEVPLHFTAFHPDYRLTDTPATPAQTCRRARAQALALGLQHVYTGNVVDPAGEATHCPGCGGVVIERNRYTVSAFRVQGGRCRACGARIPGRFEDNPGRWGPRRLPITIDG